MKIGDRISFPSPLLHEQERRVRWFENVISFDDVTVCVTSCARLDLLSATMRSFRAFNPGGRTIISEDSADAAVIVPRLISTASARAENSAASCCSITMAGDAPRASSTFAVKPAATKFVRQ